MSGDTVAGYLALAVARLEAAGIPDAARDARKLMGFALSIQPHQISAQRDRVLDAGEAMVFSHALTDRLARKPVSKISGRRAFWRHEFIVTDATLDPRPDTELLVEAALAGPFASILDLGTGTGCILLSCLAERPEVRGTGTDVSAPALDVARQNAQEIGLADRVEFLRSDWFAGVEGRFDLIVSNPPYIAAEEIAGLEPEVRLWDPEIALTPGGDGLDAYRAIAAGALAHLVPGGRLLVEIGPTQAAAVSGLFAAAGLTVAKVLPDLDGRDRVVAAQAPE